MSNGDNTPVRRGQAPCTVPAFVRGIAVLIGSSFFYLATSPSMAVIVVQLILSGFTLIAIVLSYLDCRRRKAGIQE